MAKQLTKQQIEGGTDFILNTSVPDLVNIAVKKNLSTTNLDVWMRMKTVQYLERLAARPIK